MSKFYELSAIDNAGHDFSFKQLEGKVVLIFNSASKCGFTGQLDGLEKLYEKYQDKGLVIIGFPCNQFGNQEPGDDTQIQSFCSMNYGVKFQMMKKIDVNGSNESPVYHFLKQQKSGLLGFKGIKWNFEKFLINRKGDVVSRHSSMTKPESLEKEIAALLNEK